MTPVVLHVVIVVFFATLFRSAFGFGEALVAVPLLAFRVPVEVAAPLAVLVSITVAGVIVAQDWRRSHVHSATWLVVATLFGIQIGLVFLKTAGDQVVKAVLGIAIVAFSLYAVIWRSRVHLRSDSRAWLLGCGFVAGVLGGAFGMNGPPLAIYGAMRRWSAQHFRATLQGYFLPASVIGMTGYWLAGLWTSDVTRYFLWSLPAALAAVFLGRAINRRLDGGAFLRYVYVLLLGIGATLIFQAVYGR
jgi:uncharacterized membrane protein YfcA